MPDQSDAGSVGIFSRRTNQTQEACVCSHDGPIRRSKRAFVLTMDQSDAVSVRIFSRWTNQTQEACVYYRDGPIRRSKRAYILTMDQSDAGSVRILSRWTNQTQEYLAGGAPPVLRLLEEPLHLLRLRT
eukprot:5922137-Pyramimonas_sp.AAC.1